MQGPPHRPRLAWAAAHPRSPKSSEALLEQGVSRVTVTAIGPTAFIPDVPIHFSVSSDRPLNIVESKWLDE